MIADLGDHVKRLQGILVIGRVGRVDDHALGFLVQAEKAAQGVVFQGLERFVHGGLAVVSPVGDILEEQVDLLAGDDVADVVGLGELAEDEADHLAVDQGRAAAIARVDRGIDLHSQARHSLVVAR